MPLVTTRASVAYGAGFGKVLSAGGAADLGVMFPLGMHQVGSAGVAYVDFTSIPSTYTHLQIRMIAKSQRVNTYGSTVWAYFNGDYAPSSPTNYVFHFLTGDGATASAGAYPNTNVNYSVVAGQAMGTNSTNIATVSVLDILDYKNTSKYKTARTIYGEDTNGAGEMTIASGVWLNTAAITSIRVQVDNSYNFAQYSSIALYGIKGA